ncbi:hypothetical protein BC831DRAFT_463170, partial [Entophlyctis helioformis]
MYASNLTSGHFGTVAFAAVHELVRRQLDNSTMSDPSTMPTMPMIPPMPPRPTGPMACSPMPPPIAAIMQLAPIVTMNTVLTLMHLRPTNLSFVRTLPQQASFWWMVYYMTQAYWTIEDAPFSKTILWGLAYLGWSTDLMARLSLTLFTALRLRAMQSTLSNGQRWSTILSGATLVGQLGAWSVAMYASLQGSMSTSLLYLVYVLADLMGAALDLFLCVQALLMKARLFRATVNSDDYGVSTNASVSSVASVGTTATARSRQRRMQGDDFYKAIAAIVMSGMLSIVIAVVMATGHDIYWTHYTALYSFRILFTEVFNSSLLNGIFDQPRGVPSVNQVGTNSTLGGGGHRAASGRQVHAR